MPTINLLPTLPTEIQYYGHCQIDEGVQYIWILTHFEIMKAPSIHSGNEKDYGIVLRNVKVSIKISAFHDLPADAPVSTPALRLYSTLVDTRD